MKLNAFILYNTKLINSIFDFQDNKEYSHQANIKHMNFLAARSTESGDYQSHGSRSRTVLSNCTAWPELLYLKEMHCRR